MKEFEVSKVKKEDYLYMMQDTSELIAIHQAKDLSLSAIAVQQSNALADKVEFWSWMQRNYSKSGIFDSNSSMQAFLAKNPNNEAWMLKQLQGKDYEWSWMSQKRSELGNIFHRYDAGDIANRASSDITEFNIISGGRKEYQMKAYVSKTNPHLDNTPVDMTVVTNSEKVSSVKAQGYQDVQEYKTAAQVKKSRDTKMQQIKNGTASSTYTFANVAGTIAKAGAIGVVVGAGVETVVSYKRWKSGELSNDQYLKEILKSGGNAGITSGATAGIMLPISTAVTAAGMSTLITIPIAFVVGAAVDFVVAPCFGKGQYQKILSEAKYYQNMEDIYDNMIVCMENSAEHYYEFVKSMSKQQKFHEAMKNSSMNMNKELKKLYDSI